MVEEIDQQLVEALRSLRHVSPYVVGSAVVTGDGFVVASELPDENYEKKVTLMAMAMLTMGQETTSELDSDDLERVLVETKGSYIVMVNAGPSAILAAVARKEIVLGLLFLGLKETAARISKLLY
jgi:predicted regulator of Ras-like GTPase activity (Roadblock/LC7/MglB family)